MANSTNTIPMPRRQTLPALAVFHCPACATPSTTFSIAIEDGIGICFSMTCPYCYTPVEALIRTPVVPQIGLA